MIVAACQSTTVHISRSTSRSGVGVSFMAQFARGEGHESRSRRRPHDHLERAARSSVARAPDGRDSTYSGRQAESEGAAATAARRPARLLRAVGERIPQVLAEHRRRSQTRRDSAVGTRGGRTAQRGSRKGRHAGALPAARPGLPDLGRQHRLRDDACRPVAAAHRDAQSRSHVSPDLDGRPRARGRTESVMDGILRGPLGGRYARRREQRLQRRNLARSRRPSPHGAAASD